MVDKKVQRCHNKGVSTSEMNRPVTSKAQTDQMTLPRCPMNGRSSSRQTTFFPPSTRIIFAGMQPKHRYNRRHLHRHIMRGGGFVQSTAAGRSCFLPTLIMIVIIQWSSLLSFTTHTVDAAYVASVPAKDEECYYIRPPPGRPATLYGNYDHLDDDLSSDTVSVVVVDYEEEHVLYRSRRRVSEGHFKVKLKADQKVALCLQNGLVTAGRGRTSPSDRLHDGKARTIGFSFHLDVKDEAQELKEQNSRLVDVASELTRQLGNLINHHEYMRTREAKHRELVEMTFSHLLVWVIVEALAVVVIAGGQIMYLRRFLEKRRYM